MYNWIEKLFGIIPHVLIKNNVKDTLTVYLSLLINLLILCIISFLIFFVCRKILIGIMTVLASKTKTKFDDFLIANKTAKYVAYLTPFYSFINLFQ
jgi:miniconductance mechanosensitive channel